MIPNKDFTAVHDVCRNLNNKIPTMAPTANPMFSSAAGWLLAAYTRRRGRCKGRVVVTNCPAWIYLSRLLSRYQNETIIRGRRPTWNQLPFCRRSFATYAPLYETRRSSVTEIRCFSFQARLQGFRYANDNILKHVYSSYVPSLLFYKIWKNKVLETEMLEFSVLNSPDLSFISLFNIIKGIFLV